MPSRWEPGGVVIIEQGDRGLVQIYSTDAPAGLIDRAFKLFSSQDQNERQDRPVASVSYKVSEERGLEDAVLRAKSEANSARMQEVLKEAVTGTLNAPIEAARTVNPVADVAVTGFETYQAAKNDQLTWTQTAVLAVGVVAAVVPGVSGGMADDLGDAGRKTNKGGGSSGTPHNPPNSGGTPSIPENAANAPNTKPAVSPNFKVEPVELLGGEKGRDFTLYGEDGVGRFIGRLMDGEKTLKISWTDNLPRTGTRLREAQQLAGGPGSFTRIEGLASDLLEAEIRAGRFDVNKAAEILNKSLGGKWRVQLVPRPGQQGVFDVVGELIQ